MKTAEEVSEEIKLKHMMGVDSLDRDRLVKVFAQALTRYAQTFAEARLAQRDLEQFGEAFVLGGKRIGPNEIYKSTAEYVREARAEALSEGRNAALEEAAKLVFQEGKSRPDIAHEIRALKDKT